MKICILSMQRVPNFGSVLQGYALKKMLTELGHSVSFLDIEYRKDDDALIRGYKVDYSRESAKGGLLNKIRKIDRYAINRIRIKKASILQNQLFDDYVKKVLGVADAKEKFDLCIIGSDEVFNCASTAPWGFTSQLFGNIDNATSVGTYAASCGSTQVDRLPQAVLDVIKRAFEKVSCFSVRDDNTLKFVSSLTDRVIEKHLDPVIVGNFDDEIKMTSTVKDLPQRCCIVYSYYNRINRKKEINAIKTFCKRHSLEVVSIGAPQMWINKHLVLSPFETLRAFQQAEFVITDTFHGTIFSAKYAKKFIAISRPSNENKMYSLIRDLKIEQHYAKNFEQLEAAYLLEKDQYMLNNIMAIERTKTIEYLKKLIRKSKEEEICEEE